MTYSEIKATLENIVSYFENAYTNAAKGSQAKERFRKWLMALYDAWRIVHDAEKAEDDRK